MKKLLTVLLAALMVFGLCACGGNNTTDTPGGEDPNTPPEQNVGVSFEKRTYKDDGQLYTEGIVQYPDSLWEAPEFEYDASLDPTNTACAGVKAFFMDSPITYNGKPTKIMGYIGFPEGASETNKVPGIVLVHGGLGTAYPDWVKMWNDRGYAAISIDTEGGQSKPDNMMYSGLHDERNKYANDATYTAGPTNTGFQLESAEKIGDSWMYHATSSVILANSLLRSDPRVDANKVGITGISWGGIITNIVVGYDDRYAFAMPVYGSIGLDGSSAQFGTIYPSQLAKETWDTVEPMKLSTTPILFLNSNKDFAFALDGTMKALSAAQKPYMTIKNNLPHGQDKGAEPGELAVFADAVVGKGNQVIQIETHPSKIQPTLKYRLGSEVTLNNIKLWYTEADKPNPEAQWDSKVVKFENGSNSVKLTYPEGAKYVYVSITYNNDLTASTAMISL